MVIRSGASLLLLIALVPAAQGEVYKWVKPDGTVVYSDQRPAEGAERADLPPLQTMDAPPAATSAQPTEPAAQAESSAPVTDYETFHIQEPTDDTSLWNAAGEVELTLAIDPPLAEGHRIAVLVDGEPRVSDARDTSVTLRDVTRGTHTLKAQIQDAQGEVIATTPSAQIHMHQPSTQLPQSQPLPPMQSAP